MTPVPRIGTALLVFRSALPHGERPETWTKFIVPDRFDLALQPLVLLPFVLRLPMARNGPGRC
ncbi:hypothetical protein DB459_20915 [Bradyrhizobium sp. WD16]|nr:hypothetical protein DB459_20915 [Bradyrhizobium sp. WD16]